MSRGFGNFFRLFFSLFTKKKNRPPKKPPPKKKKAAPSRGGRQTAGSGKKGGIHGAVHRRLRLFMNLLRKSLHSVSRHQ